jgi:hypothetical protein
LGPRLHIEELYDLYPSPNIIRVIKSRGIIREEYVACIDERRAYRVLVGKAEGKRPLGRTRRRRENNIKTDLKEVGWGHGLINLAQDWNKWRVHVNSVQSFLVP